MSVIPLSIQNESFMQQNGAHVWAARLFPALLVLLFLHSCTDPACQDISGRWSNREGQTFVFQPDGKALWLVRFGSQVDSVQMEYRYNCKTQPAELDFTGFSSGPLTGKTLFGILEWNSDSSFRFDAEAGGSPEVRPATFDSDQTQKFFQEK